MSRMIEVTTAEIPTVIGALQKHHKRRWWRRLFRRKTAKEKRRRYIYHKAPEPRPKQRLDPLSASEIKEMSVRPTQKLQPLLQDTESIDLRSIAPLR